MNITNYACYSYINIWKISHISRSEDNINNIFKTDLQIKHSPHYLSDLFCINIKLTLKFTWNYKEFE